MCLTFGDVADHYVKTRAHPYYVDGLRAIEVPGRGSVSLHRGLLHAIIETGCRPGELRTLQWSEVAQDHFVILPAKAKDREERKIPIMPALRKILDRRKLGPDGVELPLDAHVLGNEAGEQLSRKRLCDLWRATCERAKVKNLHLHDLRGEAGSQLLEAGVPIHEGRDALGHSSTTMTSTYLRTRTNSLAKAYKQREVHRARKVMRLAHTGQSTRRSL